MVFGGCPGWETCGNWFVQLLMKLHKKYKQTDATHREHRRGQPTLAISPTCAFGNPENTYYLHFLVILMTVSSFISSADSIHSKRCNWPDHSQLTDFNSRFSQCCITFPQKFYFLTDIISPPSLSSVVQTLIEHLAMNTIKWVANEYEKVTN